MPTLHWLPETREWVITGTRDQEIWRGEADAFTTLPKRIRYMFQGVRELERGGPARERLLQKAGL